MILSRAVEAFALWNALVLSAAAGPVAAQVVPQQPVASADMSRLLWLAEPDAWFPQLTAQQADCTASSTTIRDEYRAGSQLEIPVVVHIITDSGGSGDRTDEEVQDQIELLSNRFLAASGTVGASSIYTGIRFVLATTDPDGNETAGITRTANLGWYLNQAESELKAALSWDSRRYLNIFLVRTNSPPDYRQGYTYLPQQGVVGTLWDGVVIDHDYFRGVDALVLTHLVGHYLGLYNTFSEGCGIATEPECYTTGDLLCDTTPDAFAADYPATCDPDLCCGGFPSLIDNFMQHENPDCAQRFTSEQRNRMRCSLIAWRQDLYREVKLFEDGFESGNTTFWSQAIP